MFFHCTRVWMCRCFRGSNVLLCVPEKPEVENFMFPMWPSSLLLVLTPVLQLLQPLLLCVHNHRVSKYNFLFCDQLLSLQFCVECLKAITALNINLPSRCHNTENLSSGIIVTLTNAFVNCLVPKVEKLVLHVWATPNVCICLYQHIFAVLVSLTTVICHHSHDCWTQVVMVCLLNDCRVPFFHSYSGQYDEVLCCSCST